MNGWVYVATMNNVESVVKVCCSVEDPVLTINQWADQAGIPGVANLKYAALVDCPRRVEAAFYEELREFNTKNDWFKVSATRAMSVIKSNRKMRLFREKGSLIDKI